MTQLLLQPSIEKVVDLVRIRRRGFCLILREVAFLPVPQSGLPLAEHVRDVVDRLAQRLSVLLETTVFRKRVKHLRL